MGTGGSTKTEAILLQLLYRLNRDFEIAMVDGTLHCRGGQCIPMEPPGEPVSRLNKARQILFQRESDESSD